MTNTDTTAPAPYAPGTRIISKKDGQTYTVAGTDTNGDIKLDYRYFRFYVKPENMEAF